MPFIIFILFFCIGIALRQGALMDPDTGWHIAAGDLIRSLGGLPESDPWSFTVGDYPWYDMSWAYDLAMSLAHSAGGISAVVVVTVLLYALAAAWSGAIALKSSGSVIASFAAAVLCGFVLLPGMLARPQTLTFLLIIGFYAILRFGGARQWFLLPLLSILWASIHGAFLTGPVIVGAFFLEALAARDYPRWRHLMVVGILCAAAPLINPYGWHVFEAARLAMTSEMRALIVEWRPSAIGGFNASTALVAVFVLASGLFERRIPLADKILACFWIAMGISSSRMMHIAALLSAPYLAQAIAIRLREAPFGMGFEKRDGAYLADFSRPAVKAALAAVSAALVVAAFLPPVQQALADDAAFVAFPERTAPEAAATFLEVNYPGIRLYNQYGYGGYLIYRLRGAPPIFFDGRVEPAYPREVMRDGIAIGFVDPSKTVDAHDNDWRALVEKYEIEGFMFNAGGRPARAIGVKPGWTSVYDDGVAVIFVREDIAGR